MNKQIYPLLFLVGSIAFTGCAGVKDSMRISEKASQWNPVSALREHKAEESEPSFAQNMTVLWKESTFEIPGKKPVRGFGGRVFFYDAANNAVEANGELTVYGFDESNKESRGGAPDKKFVFSAEELKSLYGDSGLGPSYSIWVPWDKVGGFRKTVALIPIFKTDDNRVLKSGQSIGVLPGRVQEESEVSDSRPYRVLGSSPAVVAQGDNNKMTAVNENQGVSQVSFEQTVETTKTESGGIKTSTIRMTPATAQRMALRKPVPRKRYDNQLQAQPQAVLVNPATKDADEKPAKPRAAAWVDGLRANSGTDDIDKKEDAAQRRVFGVPGSFN